LSITVCGPLVESLNQHERRQETTAPLPGHLASWDRGTPSRYHRPPQCHDYDGSRG
jgi:hypothetical protein